MSNVTRKNGSNGMGHSGKGVAQQYSVLFFACFFPAALARQRFLDALLFTGFQVKGVTFYFFNDVFLLYLTLEAAQCILEGLALLNPNFSQLTTPPN